MSHARAFHSPTALPRGSWKDTLKRTLMEFKEDKLNHWAAALTFYAILSLFPALLVMVSLVGLFADPERVTKVLTDTVSELGPACCSSSASSRHYGRRPATSAHSRTRATASTRSTRGAHSGS